MTASAWIALGGLVTLLVAHIVATIWWAATTSAEVKDLRKRADEHGGVRDIVIEMRTEMRQFARAISDLAEGLREVRASPRRRQGGDQS